MNAKDRRRAMRKLHTTEARHGLEVMMNLHGWQPIWYASFVDGRTVYGITDQELVVHEEGVSHIQPRNTALLNLCSWTAIPHAAFWRFTAHKERML